MRHRIGLLFGIAAGALCTGLAESATIYVDQAATGANSGTSWTDAFTSIQPAVDTTSPGDTVLIADSTYLLDAAIVVTNAITIQGATSTIIDGDGSNRCFSLEADGVTLDGLFIGNGKAVSGGGVSCKAAAIRNCVIKGNTASGSSGGGILARGSLTLTDSQILENQSDFGAGVDAKAGAELSGCMISGNVARVDGGGLALGKACSVSNCTVTANSAGRNAGAINTSYKSAVLVTGSSITGNSATSTNSSHGGAILVTGTASVNLRDTVISGNYSGSRGGGIYNCDTVTLADCTVQNNTASDAGGGIFNFKDRSAIARNTSIISNTAPEGADIAGIVQVVE